MNDKKSFEVSDYESMGPLEFPPIIRKRWPTIAKWTEISVIDWLDREVMPKLKHRQGIGPVEWRKDHCGHIAISGGRICNRKDWPIAKRLAVLILTGGYTVIGAKPEPQESDPVWSAKCDVTEGPRHQDSIMDRNVFRRTLMVHRLIDTTAATIIVDNTEAIEAAEAAKERKR